MKLKKIAFFTSIAVVICILTALCIFTYSFNSKAASLQENVYGLKDINKDLEEKLASIEKENKELRTKIQDYSLEKEELNKRILEMDSKIKEAEEQKKSSEAGSYALVKPKQKTAYLTFDDGPSANTEKILDTLRKYGIKATFFVNGNENKLDEYKKILAEGHAIGNHTYSHDYKTVYKSFDSFLGDFDKLNVFLRDSLGYETNIFRFPGGSKNASIKKYGGQDLMKQIMELLQERDFKYFDWNVSSADADISGKPVDKDIIVKNILGGAQHKRNIIVLMHDSAGKETTAEALPEVIEGLSEQGYKFGILTKYTDF